MNTRRIHLTVSIAATACVLLAASSAAAAPVTPGPAALAGTTVEKTGNVLVVTAGQGVANDITIRRQGNVIVVTDAGDTVTAVAPCQLRSEDTVECPMPVDAVAVTGNDADDAITVSPNVDAPATVYGGAGEDRLEGGPRADRLIGDDPATARRPQATPGNDTIIGGPGNDTISGLGGNDTITGNAGNDTLNGNEGNDSLNGSQGNDTLNGGSGNDTHNGNEGNDTLNAVDGVSANDSLDGGLAVDSCNRDSGDTAVNCP
ncbi:calcium-binding protein [Streptomyces sp. 7N604]|uniref:calcium-binding protein n=1 Tax=Streptomyces sp. 7N604 TaxID=3457415 RepID=UPI003FD65566